MGKKKDYKKALYGLQVELVKLQKEVIAKGDRILVIVEGRDAAGKDGTVKRFIAHLSPRETRVVALGKPTDREESSWYFQRYVHFLPAAAEIIFFNRSWYNRAGVERVMGFCSDDQLKEFFETVPAFEQMLVRSGIKLFKYYLDISRDEQKKRLESRRENPLKQWKISPIDAAAIKHWSDYSAARDEMFTRTHTLIAPWTVVAADDKHTTRLNVMRDMLSRLDYDGKDQNLLHPDPEIVFTYDPVHIESGRIAP